MQQDESRSDRAHAPGQRRRPVRWLTPGTPTGIAVSSFETAGDHHVVVDLPRGATDLDLRTEAGALVLRGTAPSGGWSERVGLPAGVADRRARARLNNGVLAVVFER
jgi:HSP20 family molecular chaperone IbpA